MTGSRVRPRPTALSEPFWAAARRRELALQRCGDCRCFTHPPRAHCGHCGSTRWSFEPVSGRGTVETFSVVHRTYAPGFAGRVPYVIAWIALDEQPGLRMFGNVLDVDSDRVRIGMPVDVTFEEIEGFGPVPNFRPGRQECA